MFEYYKKLIALCKQNPALSSDNIEFFHEDPEAKVLAYERLHKQGSRVVVVANFSDDALGGYCIANVPVAGTWHEWMGNYDVEVGENEMVVDLPEYEAKVFVFRS